MLVVVWHVSAVLSRALNARRVPGGDPTEAASRAAGRDLAIVAAAPVVV